MQLFIHHNKNNLFIKFDLIVNLVKIVIQDNTSVVFRASINVNSDFCIIPFKSHKGWYNIQLTINNKIINKKILVG